MASELGQGARKPENQMTVFRGPGMPQRCTDNMSVPIPIDRLRIHGVLASDEGPRVRLPILGSFLSSASLCEKDNNYQVIHFYMQHFYTVGRKGTSNQSLIWLALVISAFTGH